jgi:nitroreductase
MDSKADIIFSRRSIRLYQAGPAISDNTIHFLLDAAMSAPTARNRQPWHFVVVTRKDLIEELSRRHPHANMLASASMAVLICGDTRLEEEESFLVQACSAATQNLLLAVEASGLGGVWLGVHPRKERTDALRELLGIPAFILPVSLISIGYPAEEKPRNTNYRQSRVHLNGWAETSA